MADIQHYERVFKKKHAPKALVIVLIILYCLMVCGWLVLALLSSMNLALALLVPAAIFLIAFTVWKYSQVEYEYSFTAGIFTFSKIYGKSKRKTVFSADLKSIALAKPYDADRDAYLDYSEFINAIPSSFSQNPCICIFDVNEKRTCVLIECDERSAKILRYFNPSAVDRDVLKKINSNE